MSDGDPGYPEPASLDTFDDHHEGSEEMDYSLLDGLFEDAADKATLNNSEEDNRRYLEDHHVVLKCDLSAQTVGTAIYKEQTRGEFKRRSAASVEELEAVKKKQNDLYWDHLAGAQNNSPYPDVSFWVKKCESNIEWIADESRNEVRHAKEGKTDIEYVRATDECLKNDMKNNFGRTSGDRKPSGGKKKKKTSPPPAPTDQDTDNANGNGNGNLLEMTQAFFKVKLGRLVHEAAETKKYVDESEESKAARMGKICSLKVGMMETIIDNFQQMMYHTNTNTAKLCQKKTIPISGPPGMPPVELILCHGSVVNFSPKCHPEAAGLVCATNESCEPMCAGVTWAVTVAGEDQLLKDLSALPESHPKVRCPTGSAIAIPATPSENAKVYGKLGVGHVIYTVGPSYEESFPFDEGKRKKDDEILKSAYQKSLNLAEERKLQAVAFSLVSAGRRNNSQDPQRVLRIAVDTILGYKEHFRSLKEVYLCAYTSDELEKLESIMALAENEMKQAAKTDG